METEISTAPDPGRRSLLNWFLGTSAFALLASVVYPILRFITPPRVPEATTNRVEVGPANDPELLEKGYKIVRFGVEPVILVRVAAGDLRAFSATCTHLDCIVEFQPTNQRIWCNCHSGAYNLKGQVISGPPPRPLAEYAVHLLKSAEGSETVVISRS